MHVRTPSVALGFFVACVALAHPCCAQAPAGAAAATDTQKQLDALRVQVNAMQKDLDEIKALLAPLRARQAPTSVVLDLGNRPVKGGPAAKLTLVELTDYQ